MNYEIIKEIIDTARFAPTGDNCDPWRFVWCESILSIHHRLENTQSVYDNNFHTSLLTLGLLIEVIKIKALEQGVDARFHIHFNHVKENSYAPRWADVEFVPTQALNDPLLSAVKKRVTDRRPFLANALSVQLLRAIRQETERFTSTRVSVVQDIPGDLLDFIITMEGYVWHHGQAFLDLARWLRLTQTEIDQTDDGMIRGGLGCRAPEIWSLFFLRRFPALHRFFSLLGSPFIARAKLKNNLKNSSLIAFSSTRTDNEAIVEAGRSAMRTWLTLTAKGYGAQPLTIQSLFVFDLHCGGIQSPLQASYKKTLKKGLSIIRKSFGLENDAYPVWILRVGKATAFKDASRTKRLPVESLLKIQ